MAVNRDAEDFTRPTVGELTAAGVRGRATSEPSCLGFDALERFRRVPNHAMFLFTSEDALVNQYIRDHWAALDGLSGDACDIHQSVLQLLGGEDFYSQIADVKSIAGLEAVRPVDLPALHIWSKAANCTIRLGRLTTEASLRDTLRTVFTIIHESGGPISAEDASRLRRVAEAVAGIQSARLQAVDPLGLSRSTEEDSVDPLTVMTLISSGLKLVDQFRELAIRFRKQQPTPPSARAEQAGSALEVRHNGTVTAKIEATQLHMDQWDTTRFEALRKRIRTNWDIFNDLFTSEAGASALEGAKIRAEMRNVQETLCRDFKEMVGLYERTLGTSLPDHYQLFEVCAA